jgi:hypothetical protein
LPIFQACNVPRERIRPNSEDCLLATINVKYDYQMEKHVNDFRNWIEQ